MSLLNPIGDPDDAYRSSEDSDFDAEVSALSGEDSASSDDEGQKPTARTKKRRVDVDGDLEMGSGDEGVIAQGRKKRRKKGKGKGKKSGAQEEAVEGDDDEEEAGRIRVRLRSGRGGEEKSKKPIPNSSAAAIDVDSIWARMNAPLPVAPPPPPPPPPPLPSSTSPGKENKDPDTSSPPKPALAAPTEEIITIPHTYTFAGQTHTTHKDVPISSPEAQAYLQSRQNKANKSRPLARKNLLEPNPSRLVNGQPSSVRIDLPPSIGGSMPKGKAVEKKSKDPKLNTVEKSKLDWEAEVERRGLREELEKEGKSGKNYLSRKEFLDRVDIGRDDRERAERLKGKG